MGGERPPKKKKIDKIATPKKSIRKQEAGAGCKVLVATENPQKTKKKWTERRITVHMKGKDHKWWTKESRKVNVQKGTEKGIIKAQKVAN